MLEVVLLQGRLHVGLSLYLIDSTEDKVHLLQGLSLGLLEEESNECTHSSTEATEHDEGPPADRVDGTWGDLSDDEIEKPLSRSSKTDTIRSETSGENLNMNSKISEEKKKDKLRLHAVHTPPRYTQGVGPQEKEYPMT